MALSQSGTLTETPFCIRIIIGKDEWSPSPGEGGGILSSSSPTVNLYSGDKVRLLLEANGWGIAQPKTPVRYGADGNPVVH